MNAHRARIALAWLGLIAAGLLAAWVRYRLIEPPLMAQQCAMHAASMACTLRQLVVAGFLNNTFGNLALAAAVLALLWRHPVAAWLAAALGVVAVQLYCYETGALALLIGCLLLVQRLPAAAALAGQPDRRGEQPVQPQP